MDESPRPCQPNWPTSALLVQQQQVGGSQVVVAPVRELLLHFLPRPAVVHRHLRHSVVVQDVPLPSTATPSTYQTWNWVTGSPFTSWSPGHHFDPVWDASFSGFRKKAQDKDIYFWWKSVQPSLKYWHLINDLQNFTFQKRANAKQR